MSYRAVIELEPTMLGVLCSIRVAAPSANVYAPGGPFHVEHALLENSDALDVHKWLQEVLPQVMENL